MNEAVPNYRSDTLTYPAPALRIGLRVPQRRPMTLAVKKMVPVRRGVPLPERTTLTFAPTTERFTYPWTEMEVGDSFIFPNRNNLIHTQRLASSSVAYRHAMWAQRYTVRTIEEDGQVLVGVWRVE